MAQFRASHTAAPPIGLYLVFLAIMQQTNGPIPPLYLLDAIFSFSSCHLQPSLFSRLQRLLPFLLLPITFPSLLPSAMAPFYRSGTSLLCLAFLLCFSGGHSIASGNLSRYVSFEAPKEKALPRRQAGQIQPLMAGPYK